MSESEGFLDNNDHYARAFAKGGLPRKPTKRVAIIACMDARLDPARVLALEEGDAHVIRNAGGVVTDDVIRSLVISQRLQGTEEIVLIHHTDCGMTAFRDEDVQTQIEAETGARPPFALEAFTDVDANLLESIARIEASPFVPCKHSIRGFVYDVDTGRLRAVDASAANDQTLS